MQDPETTGQIAQLNASKGQRKEITMFRWMAAFLCIGLSGPAAAELVLIDGDTLEIDGTRYRINAIDAPEYGQKCPRVGGGTWNCGEASLDALQRLVSGQAVTCAERDRDDYQRVIATCYAGDTDVGEALVQEGLAWAYVRFSDEYVAQEAAARAGQIGVWQSETLPAWEFRRQKWSLAEQEAPDGCPIKGNISQNGKIYHTPWSPWYSRTKINVSKGERWFCDEAEALDAGWRAPRWR